VWLDISCFMESGRLKKNTSEMPDHIVVTLPDHIVVINKQGLFTNLVLFSSGLGLF
jgi:hypothetical protein